MYASGGVSLQCDELVPSPVPSPGAAATLTLALPKAGLRPAADFAGEPHLADIGVPPELYSEPTLGLEVGPIFARQEILRL